MPLYVSGTLFILGIAGSLIWMAFTVANNSHLRTQAAKTPNSLLFWIVLVVDSCVKATLLRPLEGARRSNPQRLPADASRKTMTERPALHDFAQVDGLISIRQSFSVSLDLSTKIPPLFLKRIGSPEFMAQAKLAPAIPLSLMVIAGALLVLPREVILPYTNNPNSDQGWIVFLVAMAVLFACMYISSRIVEKFLMQKNGFLDTLQSLHASPHWMLTIDDKLVRSDSAWGRWMWRNTAEVQFEPTLNRFNLGIVLRTGTHNRQDVFFFPRQFDSVIMNEQELTVLYTRLNALLGKARKQLPVRYEEIDSDLSK